MRLKIACGMLCLLCAASSARGADDWMMWNDFAVKVPLIKDTLDLNGIYDMRFRDDMDEFYRYHFYVGPDYYPWKWLTLGLQYGNVQQKPEGGDFQTEHRFMGFVTPKFTLGDIGLEKPVLKDLKFTLQNRLEWRIRHYAAFKDTWRYRFYPKLSYPIYKGEKLDVSPYVGDAFYFPLEDSIYFNENRIYSGLVFKLYKHLSLDFYYMYDDTRKGRGGDWTGGNVLGSVVTYEF
ncbi:MAG: DUF2490 domain-containing protein [Chlamydiota bacterium]